MQIARKKKVQVRLYLKFHFKFSAYSLNVTSEIGSEMDVSTSQIIFQSVVSWHWVQET